MPLAITGKLKTYPWQPRHCELPGGTWPTSLVEEAPRRSWTSFSGTSVWASEGTAEAQTRLSGCLEALRHLGTAYAK